MVCIRAGSLPTSGSVNKKALTLSYATCGRYLRFCSSVPNTFNGSGTPIDWWADSNVGREACHVPDSASARP